MPGIVTHSRVLKESVSLLSRREKKSYLLRSIETLFHTPDHYTAGLYGAIGPNMFDYIPPWGKPWQNGVTISFYLHDGGFDRLLQTMVDKIIGLPDKNTEWSAVQRSYLYGFISHVITDSIFNPYILYYSGFPSGTTKKEINHFREQNLLFKYNLDNYFQYHDDRSKEFTFALEDMLPRQKYFTKTILDHSLRTFILDSIKIAYPDIYRQMILPHKNKSGSESLPSISSLAILPSCIRIAYRLKRTNNVRLADFFRYLRRNNLLYSNFIIRYPMNRRYNKNILNLHRERWENPAGKPGLHYESIHNLLALSCEKTIEVWEKIESSLYTKKVPELSDYIDINAFTGDRKLAYRDLKTKNPIRLSS